MISFIDILFLWIFFGFIGYCIDMYGPIKKGFRYNLSEVIVCFLIAIVLGLFGLVLVVYNRYIKKRR